MEAIFLLGNILKPIASVLGFIMNWIYEFFNLFGVQNIALSIFVFTFIVKTLMIPLTIKQQKFSRLQSRITPEIQKIQEKYKGKRDEVSMRKQQAETQAVYQKYGASPTAGCLPLLITLPIMFALYRVINNIPDFVNLVREPYKVVADAILPNTGVISDIVANFENLKLTTIDEVINSLATFNTSQWDLLLSKGLGETVNAAIESIIRVNNFFGLSITNTPSWKSISVIIPLLAMSLQFVQSKQISVKPEKKDNTPNPMASMNVIMPIMSGFFCLMLPIGVGLYWIANSLFSIIQQFFVNKHLDSMDIDELVEKSQEKAMSKLTKKSSTGGASIQELAKKQTKSIESVSDRIKDSSKNNNNDDKVDIDNDTEKDSYNPTSISEIANLLKNRNSEKGDK
ncbi:MAG: YidC/Oxa1 family membrane protein insertase [Clostridiales bacterium]|nr:YidC/Oxa1 family membrane protein insertase [Clostridiales bacterium]